MSLISRAVLSSARFLPRRLPLSPSSIVGNTTTTYKKTSPSPSIFHTTVMTRRPKLAPALTLLLASSSSLDHAVCFGFTLRTHHAVPSGLTPTLDRSPPSPTTAIRNPRRRFSTSSSTAAAVGHERRYDETNVAAAGLGSERSSILICGDGDLSFGAAFATRLAEDGGGDVGLVVSVLDEESEHSDVFRDSVRNQHTIRNLGHEVLFGLDATDLSRRFSGEDEDDLRYFDRIQFNFPHWKGKTNAKKNRELLRNFFTSSQKHLTPHGEIHVALTERQGGMYAGTVNEWKQSWMPARYAAESGLLLERVMPFKPTYNLSAYKWKDQAFAPGESYMYIFSNCAKEGGGCDEGVEGDRNTPSTMKVTPDIQLYSYFNILIALPPSHDHNNDIAGCMKDEILNLQNFVGSHSPDGIRAEVKLDKIMEGTPCRPRMGEDDDTADSPTAVEENQPYAVCRITLYGETRPLTQRNAEAFRVGIEECLMKEDRGVLRKNRWCASNVFPVSVLGSVRRIGV